MFEADELGGKHVIPELHKGRVCRLRRVGSCGECHGFDPSVSALEANSEEMTTHALSVLGLSFGGIWGFQGDEYEMNCREGIGACGKGRFAALRSWPFLRNPGRMG
jgi:hypothetical protein